MNNPPYILNTAADVTYNVLSAVAECVEDRYADQIMPLEEFIDRLCDDYADGWDIERLDTPAVRKIMRYAYYVKRDLC